MAERVEILSIKLDAAGALKEMTDIGLQLRQVTDSKKALEAAYKTGAKTEREYVQGMIEIKTQTNALNAQQSAYQRTLNANQHLIEKNNGSLESMRAELSGLTAQYSKLTREERENVKVGGEMLTRMASLSDELKTQEAAYGSTGRNVGNYTQGILKAADGTGLLASLTENMTAAQEGFKGALDITKASMVGNVSALKLFRLALAATGIGLVVLALGGLISYLTRTQEGIDFVSQKTKGLQLVFKVLMDRLSGVGEAIFKAFDNPKQAVNDLVELIGENLMNRVKAFVVIWDALRNRDFNKLQDGVFQLGTGITDATKKAQALKTELLGAAAAGARIEKENQRIRDMERALNVEREKSRAIVEKLKMISDDTTKGLKERIKATKEGFAIESGLDAKTKKILESKIKNIQAELILSNNLIEDKDRLAEAEKELAQMNSDSIGKQTELQNMLNGLIREGAAAAKADADAKAKVAADAKKAAEDLKKETAEADKAIRAKELQTAQEGTKSIFDNLELANKEAHAKGLLNEEKYNANLQEVKSARLTAEITDLERYVGKVEGVETEIANKKIELANFVADNKIAANTRATDEAIANAKREAAETEVFVSQVSDLVTGAMTEQGFNLQKFSQGVLMMALDAMEKMVTVQVLGATASATAGSMAQPDSIATFGATGLVRAAILGGLIKTAFTVFKAAITQKMTAPAAGAQKFAEGGILQGASHAAGGIRGTGSFAGIEVEGDEVIINRNSSRRFIRELNAINIAGGGRPLIHSSYNAPGGIIPTPTRRALGSFDAGIDYNRLANVLSNIPAPQVAVKEIVSGINRVQAKESRVNA